MGENLASSEASKRKELETILADLKQKYDKQNKSIP